MVPSSSFQTGARSCGCSLFCDWISAEVFRMTRMDGTAIPAVTRPETRNAARQLSRLVSRPESAHARR